MLSRLFVKLLSDYLNEIAYDAELAGLSWGLQNTVSGFLVSFLGYVLFQPYISPAVRLHPSKTRDLGGLSTILLRPSCIESSM